MNLRNAFPLSWPIGWKRHTSRSSPRFDLRSMDQAATEVLNQLRMIGVGNWEVIISTNIELRRDGLPKSNQPLVADPGVAVYFKLKGQERVLACDKWVRPEYNLWAIAKHIDSMRAQDRWGVGNITQAFAGYLALMSGREIRDWWDVFGLAAHAPTDTVLARYKALAMTHHPDRGGPVDKMAELNEAMATFKKERGL